MFCADIVNWDLNSAKNRAREVETNLKIGNHPICCIPHRGWQVSYFDDYFSSLFPVKYGGYGSEEVKRIEVDFNSARRNPDDYFKPLDIVMICREGGMVHACIYLGSGKICHALNGNQVKIENWNNFFILTGANKMLRYHPVIAFKKTDEIIKHIANCAEKQETYYSREKKGDFSIYKNNCENFTNRCVLGIDFSQLAETKKEKKDGTPRKRELDIEEQLNKTKEKLDNLTNSPPWNKISEIQRYRRGSGYESFDINRDGIRMEERIEVQPKTSIFKDMVSQYNTWIKYRN